MEGGFNLDLPVRQSLFPLLGHDPKLLLIALGSGCKSVLLDSMPTCQVGFHFAIRLQVLNPFF